MLGCCNEGFWPLSCHVTARLDAQQKKLNFPILPTTTIGSFPQTFELRRVHREFKANKWVAFSVNLSLCVSGQIKGGRGIPSLFALPLASYWMTVIFIPSGSPRKSMLTSSGRKSAKLLETKKSLIFMYLYTVNQRFALTHWQVINAPSQDYVIHFPLFWMSLYAEKQHGWVLWWADVRHCLTANGWVQSKPKSSVLKVVLNFKFFII